MKPCALLLALSLIAVDCSLAQRASQKSAPASCGPLAAQLFKCPKFGFTYKVPFGWVDRTNQMQSPSADDSGTNTAEANHTREVPGKPSGNGATSSSGQSQTLLAVFERPPRAAGETIDSAVVIASEDRQSYPQIKTAADYFGPISDVAAQRGFKPVGDPYAFSIGARQLVRGDFTGEHGKLPIFQSSLVMINKGEIVSFTFLAGSEDDVDSLIDNLSFAPTRQQHPLK